MHISLPHSSWGTRTHASTVYGSPPHGRSNAEASTASHSDRDAVPAKCRVAACEKKGFLLHREILLSNEPRPSNRLVLNRVPKRSPAIPLATHLQPTIVDGESHHLGSRWKPLNPPAVPPLPGAVSQDLDNPPTPARGPLQRGLPEALHVALAQPRRDAGRREAVAVQRAELVHEQLLDVSRLSTTTALILGPVLRPVMGHDELPDRLIPSDFSFERPPL
mmetsp:Transcript_30531/g.97170  ORF Transcript_30531/g.97170 Transcript_30531/m.97170 type:complete len:220 (-) Transcript_30531:1041-1700(-)